MGHSKACRPAKTEKAAYEDGGEVDTPAPRPGVSACLQPWPLAIQQFDLCPGAARAASLSSLEGAGLANFERLFSARLKCAAATCMPKGFGQQASSSGRRQNQAILTLYRLVALSDVERATSHEQSGWCPT